MKSINEQSNFIVLRNTQEGDLDFVINAEREPSNAQYVIQWTKEQHKDALFHDDMLHLTVENKATNKPIGYIIMAGLTDPNRNVELKRIVISDKGKGFGREALKLVRKISFEYLNAHRLWLDVIYGNHGAQNLYKSEGFIKEGILRESMFHNGNYESLIIMSILEDEYNNNFKS